MSVSASANKTEDAGWQSTENTMFSSHPLNVSRLSSNFIAELKCLVPVLKTIKHKSFIEILFWKNYIILLQLDKASLGMCGAVAQSP